MDTQEETPKETKTCPHCQKEIPVKARRCPYCQTDLRAWYARHPILSVLLVLIILAIIGSAIGSSNQPSAPTTSYDTNPPPATTPAPLVQTSAPAQTTPAESSPAPAPTSTATWHTVATFSGETQKNTSPFVIQGSQWRITWQDTGDGYFGATAQTTDGNNNCSIANLAGSGSDTTYCYSPGTYYISVNTSQAWSMTVQDYY